MTFLTPEHTIGAVFIIYIFIVLTLGLIAGFMVKNLSDYLLAGRNLSGAVMALGVGASDMSSWLLMALPGATFILGINQIWLPIGLAIGAYLNWQFEAKRLRVFSESMQNALTIPAYLSNRFHDHNRILCIIATFVILICFTIYTAAQFVAGGLLIKSIFNIPYFYSLLITSLIIVTYTCIGGFLAISWIDFFQGILMFFALLIVPFFTIKYLHGTQQTLMLLSKEIPFYLDAFHGISFLGIISLLAWSLGYFGQPHIIIRFMATRSSKEIPIGRFICMMWMILALYGAIFTGLSGAAYFKHIGSTLAHPETIFLVLAKTLFNPWVAGLLIAAVLSATMNVSSAQLLASASALTEDFYHSFLRKQASPKELMFIVRLCVFLVALIAISIASRPGSTILGLVAYAWAGLGASFGPVILISLYWKRITRYGAMAGMATGAISVILWEILDKNFGGIFQLYSILPAFVLNIIVIYFVSRWTTLDPDVIKQFDQAIHHMNS